MPKYRATGAALTGFIHDGKTAEVAGVATSDISPVGGTCASKAGGGRLSPSGTDWVTWKSSTAESKGSGKGNTFETSAVASIDGLTITNRQEPNSEPVSLTAERLAVKVTAKHTRGAKSVFVIDPPAYSGLRLGDVPVTLQLNEKILGQPLTREQLAGQPLVTGVVIGKRTCRGNSVKAPGLGTVTFGEIEVKTHQCRVSLLTVHLGSSVDGYLSGPMSEPNGVWD